MSRKEKGIQTTRIMTSWTWADRDGGGYEGLRGGLLALLSGYFRKLWTNSLIIKK